MKFSLVMATLGRVQEVSRNLNKLSLQIYRNFELIVVDQNPDDRLLEILEPYRSSFSITHLRSSLPGASRSRNLGLQQADGDIIAFPDDDCWYPEDLLERVNVLMTTHSQWGILSGSSAGDSYWHRKAGQVTPINVWKRGIEYSLFIKRQVFENIGDFDETLGPGSGTDWWAGEGTDLMLRALTYGHEIYYDPSIAIHHPGPIHNSQHVNDDNNDMTKPYHYGMGKGRVLRKSNSPLWFLLYQCIKPLGKSLMGVIQQQPTTTKLNWSVFKGILDGWKN